MPHKTGSLVMHFQIFTLRKMMAAFFFLLPLHREQSGTHTTSGGGDFKGTEISQGLNAQPLHYHDQGQKPGSSARNQRTKSPDSSSKQRERHRDEMTVTHTHSA